MQPGSTSYIDFCLCTLYSISEGESPTETDSEETQFERRECSVIVVMLSTNSKALFSWRGDKEASCGEMSESVFWHVAH